MAEETYKLTYFDLRARAEPARAMLTMAGQKFEDIRVLPQNWENLKPETPLGFLPILETSRGTICQTPVINYYVAEKTGYLPDDEFERVQCNSILHTLNDLSAFVSKNVLLSELYKHCPSPDNIDELKEQARYELRKTSTFIQGLSRKGSKFIFGDKMTAADITMFCSWMLIEPVFPRSKSKEDWLNKFMESMETDSKFAKYLQERPDDILSRAAT
ncbi:glutathione S-transferase 1-like isoform X1 [Watersipora subatra]|uniref:glutathione S-transferase 1-like isoform X1 n=1 Tax=Watersipora subatra TaxID=2589382 RepID=UPI00355BDEE5